MNYFGFHQCQCLLILLLRRKFFTLIHHALSHLALLKGSAITLDLHPQLVSASLTKLSPKTRKPLRPHFKTFSFRIHRCLRTIFSFSCRSPHIWVKRARESRNCNYTRRWRTDSMATKDKRDILHKYFIERESWLRRRPEWSISNSIECICTIIPVGNSIHVLSAANKSNQWQ